MTDYDRKLHAALMHICQHILWVEHVLSNSNLIHERLPWDPALRIPPFSNSGPGSVDATDGGPPPAVAASPAGANLIQRLELVERYIGPSALEWARSQPSGTPGTAAAKESSDTTAAAPVGAALHDADGDMPRWGCLRCGHQNRSVSRRCMRCGEADPDLPPPESHACHPGERECNCDQALELQKLNDYVRRSLEDLVTLLDQAREGKFR